MINPELKQLILDSIKFQKLVFYFMAGFFLSSTILVVLLVIFLPTEPGEENAKFFVIIFGLIFLIATIMTYRYARDSDKKIFKIFDNPSQVKKIKSVVVRSKGITAHAIHFILYNDKKVGLNVFTKTKKERILDLLQQEYGMRSSS